MTPPIDPGSANRAGHRRANPGRTWRWLLPIGLIGRLVVAQTQPSLLLNSSFEEGAGAAATGWTFAAWPNPRATPLAGALARSQARARTGVWALRIDTQPLLSNPCTLVFNGTIASDVARLRGKRLDLSGWVYVEAGAALRPFGLVLRVWGTDQRGKTVLAGTPFSTSVLGRPGEWVSFRASGQVPDTRITSMDLHCSIKPDAVRTVQFIDDVRLVEHETSPFDLRLPCDALWRDETVLPVEIRLAANERSWASLTFELADAYGRVAARWPRSPQAGIHGLALPRRLLDEGVYTLRAELVGTDQTARRSSARLELVASPWEGFAEPSGEPSLAPRRADAVPEVFRVMGSVAPTSAPDVLPGEPEPLAEGMVPPEAAERGFVVFARSRLDPVSRLGRPRPGELEGIRLFGAPGQYLSAAVSAWALKPLRGLRVWVDGLRGPGQAIAPAELDVRVVRQPAGLPAFLEKRPGVDLPAEQTQTFWLTLRLPSGTPPGLYAGQVTIVGQDTGAARMKLLVRVLPWPLPPVEKGYGFWWKMDGRWDGYYSTERRTALDQVRRQLILLREHGCNMVSLYGLPRMERGRGGLVRFDFENDHFGHDRFSLSDLLRVGRETGFFRTDQPVQYPGAELLFSEWVARSLRLAPKSKEFEAFFQDACRSIDRWARARGVTLAFACVDEIGNSDERVQTALRAYRLAKEAGVLTSVTDNSMHGGVHLLGQPRFDHLIDLRLYNYITPEMIESARAAKDRLWLYNLGSGGGEPARDRLAFGFFAERCGADGCAQWAFQWPHGNRSPYPAAAAAKEAGYHYALPAPDGPLPTLSLEALRDGIDDARYVAQLRRTSPAAAADLLADLAPYSPAIADSLMARRGNSEDMRRWKIARAALTPTR